MRITRTSTFAALLAAAAFTVSAPIAAASPVQVSSKCSKIKNKKKKKKCKRAQQGGQGGQGQG